MTLATALGLVAALASAILYAAGVTLQAIEARESPADESLKLALLKDLIRRKRWLKGTACVVGGWIMQAVALTTAPITIVQPALALSVVALLVISVRYFGESVARREVVGAAAIVIGVAGLAVVAPGESNDRAAAGTLAIGMTALAAVALAPYILHAKGKDIGILIIFSAGLAYAWTGFSTAFLSDELSTGDLLFGLLWLAATVIAAGVGLLSEMTALQTQSAIRVFPIVLVTQIVVAVLLAPLLAGETWEPSAGLLAVAVASLALLAAGTHALATCHAVSRVVAAR